MGDEEVKIGVLSKCFALKEMRKDELQGIPKLRAWFFK